MEHVLYHLSNLCLISSYKYTVWEYIYSFYCGIFADFDANNKTLQTNSPIDKIQINTINNDALSSTYLALSSTQIVCKQWPFRQMDLNESELERYKCAHRENFVWYSKIDLKKNDLLNCVLILSSLWAMCSFYLCDSVENEY